MPSMCLYYDNCFFATRACKKNQEDGCGIFLFRQENESALNMCIDEEDIIQDKNPKNTLR